VAEETEIIEIKPKNMYIPICITQAICIAVILLSVLIVKFFFSSSYAKLQNWCTQNILEETKITAFSDREENT